MSSSKSLKTKKKGSLNLKISKTFVQLFLPFCWEVLNLSVQNDHDLKLADRMNSLVQQSYHLEEGLTMLHYYSNNNTFLFKSILLKYFMYHFVAVVAD